MIVIIHIKSSMSNHTDVEEVEVEDGQSSTKAESDTGVVAGYIIFFDYY